MIDDPGLTFPRYCEHGKLCDDQCDECDREQAEEAATEENRRFGQPHHGHAEP